MKHVLPVSLVTCLWLLVSPTARAIVDVNDNDLSDLWEKAHNDGNLFPATFDPQADPDGDGWTNAQEAAAGTDPFDANQLDGFIRPEIIHVPAVIGAPDENGTPVVITPEAVTITWPTLVGKKYTLLVSVDLLEGNWIAVGDSFIGTGNEFPYGFEINGPDKYFWRVAVADVDSDDDGLTDAEEAELGSNSGLADTDFDGINDSAESTYSTSLILWDTDGDGSGDGEEVSEGKDPVSAASFPPQWRYVERILHYGFGNPVPEDPPPYSHLVTQQLWDPVSTSVSDLQAEIGWIGLSAQLTSGHAFPATPATPRRIGLGSWTNTGALIPSGEPPKYATLHDRRYWLVIDSPKDTPVAKNFLKFTRRTVNTNAPVETVELLSAIVPASQLVSSPVDISAGLTTNPAFSSTTSQHETVLIQNLDITISWKAVAGFDNVDDHVDPWGMPIHGKRIFPDLKDPDATEIQNKLEVIVKTSPALAGKSIFVKSFDVDDSTSEEFDREEDDGDTSTPVNSTIDTNDKSGGDNLPDYLGTGPNGHFWTGSAWGDNTAQGIIAANGEAKFVFRVGMQPGSNYRIVASLLDESMYQSVQTTNSAALTYLGPESHQNGGAPASPLLTVWRKLWVENDSMDAIPEGEFNYKRNDFHGSIQSPHIYNSLAIEEENSTSFSIPKPSDLSSFNNLENGVFIIQNNPHDVVDTWIELSAGSPPEVGDTLYYWVKIQKYLPNVSGSPGFRLYDDDDYKITAPLPFNSLVDSVVRDVYKPAFIDVVDSANWNELKIIEFQKSAPPLTGLDLLYGVWDDALDSKLDGSEKIWCATIVCGYQGSTTTDGDPKIEGHEEGNTPVRLYYNQPVDGGANISIIWLECIRDYMETVGLIRNTSADVNLILQKYLTRIKLTAAHEIGHQPNFMLGEAHHNEGALMQSGGSNSGEVDNDDSKFSPKTILRFRKTPKWTSE